MKHSLCLKQLPSFMTLVFILPKLSMVAVWVSTERNLDQMKLHAIDAAIIHFNATLIDIEAQEYAREFYEGVGFRQSSVIFMLDGILHIKMTWEKKE